MKKLETVNLMICDDHGVTIDGLVGNFDRYAPHFKIVGRALSGEDLLELLKRTQPDIILLDLFLRTMTGLEVLKILKEKYPLIRTIIYSGHKKEYYEHNLILDGARAYLDKNENIEDTIKTIEKVYVEGYSFNSSVSRHIFKAQKQNKEIDYLIDGIDLTKKDVELLEFLCDGKTSKEIGVRLGISHKTVELRKENLKNKLGRKSTTSLIHYAITNGIVNWNKEQ